MKKRFFPLLGCTVLVVILMTTCGLTPLENLGTLVLKLSSEPLLTVKTIVPDFDMDPAYYDIYGSGPGGTEFEQLGLEGDSTAQAALLPGEWTIYVEAFNADPTLIGTGEATVTVLAGAVSDVVVVVEPVPGTGQLDVTVSWPDGVLYSPVVVGTLVPAGGTDVGIAFETGDDPLLAQYLSAPFDAEEALPTGYYTLSLWLSTETADHTDRDTVWGTVEAVRIINRRVSQKLFELVEDVNRGGITILTEFDNPFEVTITGVDSEVLVGSEITAVAQPSGADRYEWYLDGNPVGTGETLTFGGVGLGHHWLSVVVTDGSILSSDTVEFDVVREFSGSSLWGVMVWGYDVWG